MNQIKSKFYEKIDKAGPGDCWNWLGAINDSGYGIVSLGGRNLRAHRVSWELKNKKQIPDGKCVLHRCDNRPCVNPDHLFLGTRADNVSDMDDKGRRKSGIGNGSGQAKLSEADISEIWKATFRGETNREIAGKYGVSHTSIWQVLNGRTWVAQTREMPRPAPVV